MARKPTKSKDHDIIAPWIARRVAAKIPSLRVAAAMGMTYAYVRMAERGLLPRITPELAQRYADAVKLLVAEKAVANG